MKIYMNRSPVRGPWGGGAHWINAFHDHVVKNHELVGIEEMMQSPKVDVVLLAGLDTDNVGGISAEQAVMFQMFRPDVKLVMRINENDARKNTNYIDAHIMKLAEHMDGVVYVSNWLKEYFEDKGIQPKSSRVIINGVDGNIFKPGQKLNNGKLNLVTHHWSNNELKGFDIYDQLDKFVGENSDKFTFTYIGRDRKTFKNTKLIAPLSGQKLGEELGKYDVYISASRFDPGPNHVTEALSCGLPTLVHKDGGGSVEFAGSNSVYSTWDELQKIIVSGNIPKQNGVKLTEWNACVVEYADYLEELCRQSQ